MTSPRRWLITELERIRQFRFVCKLIDSCCIICIIVIVQTYCEICFLVFPYKYFELMLRKHEVCSFGCVIKSRVQHKGADSNNIVLRKTNKRQLKDWLWGCYKLIILAVSTSKENKVCYAESRQKYSHSRCGTDLKVDSANFSLDRPVFEHNLFGG